MIRRDRYAGAAGEPRRECVPAALRRHAALARASGCKHRPVAALDPSRYHLSGAYDVDGIIFAGQEQEGPWELKDIVEHLNAVYVGRIAYEVCVQSVS